MIPQKTFEYQRKPGEMSNEAYSRLSGLGIKLKRLWRSIRMWGVHRTLAKVANRTSLPIRPVITLVPRKRDTLLVGCGQFGASTASFFISKVEGNRLLACYDINDRSAERIRRAYGYKQVSSDYSDMLDLPGAKYVLIASNHASHTNQAIEALKRGLTVHVEKPISVTWEQLAELKAAVEGHEDKFFVGYNRPFAKALFQLREHLPAGDGPFTIDCFVAGHAIDPTHWYYDPAEGTRICGNVGHWIDMSVHLLSQRSLPDNLTIDIAYSDAELREENFALSMTSDRGDLVNMVFTTRGEPFDGVNETIHIQHGPLMAKIDDFRTMKLWNHDELHTFRYRPKDVGHRASVVQMFDTSPRYARPWNEVLFSTMLMLHITDMVRAGETSGDFSLSATRAKIDAIQNHTKHREYGC